MSDILIVKRRHRAFITARTDKGLEFLINEMGLDERFPSPASSIDSEFVDEFKNDLETDFDLSVEVIG